MILNSLVLENIRSYDREEIEIPTGTVLFEGDIGSGKSTILMAVEFALFGSAPKSMLAKKKQMGQVTLEFTVDGKRYEISRALVGKDDTVTQDSKKSYIKVDGEKEPLSASELKQRVLGILKFNEPASTRSESRIYRYAVFTPQEEMKSVLMEPKKRLETMRRAFGIEDYSSAVENSDHLAAEIKERAARFEERSRGMEEMEEESKRSEGAADEARSEINSLKDGMAAARSEKDAAIKRHEQLQEKKIQKNTLEGKRNQIIEKIGSDQSRVKSASAEIAGMEAEAADARASIAKMGSMSRPTERTTAEIQESIDALEGAQKTLDEERIRYEECTGRLSRMNVEKAQDVEEEIGQMEKEIEEGKDELGQITDKEGALKTKETETETQAGLLRKEIVEISELGERCPTCKQDIDVGKMEAMKKDRSSKIDELNEALKEIRAEISDAKKGREEKDGAVQKIEGALAEKRQMVAKIKEFEEESERQEQIRKKMSEAESRYNSLEKESGYTEDPTGGLSKLLKSLNEYEKNAAQAGEIEKRLKSIGEAVSRRREESKAIGAEIIVGEEEAQKIEASLETFSGIDKEVEVITAEIDRCSQKADEISHRIGSAEQSLQDEERRIKDNQEKIKEARMWRGRFAKYSEYRDWLGSFFKTTVSKIEKEVMLSILQNFDESYRKWYSMLIDDPTKESKIDEDFTPSVSQDGFEQDIDHMSGGEKTSISLAYRLALNTLLRSEAESLKSNLLILDEPTDGFSKSQLAKMKDVLDELGSEQVILVSHDQELGAYVDNVFRVTKNNGKSSVRKA